MSEIPLSVNNWADKKENEYYEKQKAKLLPDLQIEKETPVVAVARKAIGIDSPVDQVIYNLIETIGIPWMGLKQKRKLKNIFTNIFTLPEEEQEQALTSTELFTSLPLDQQEQALFLLQSFNERVKQIPQLSPLEQLKEDYTKFPTDKKMIFKDVKAHLKSELKDYIKIWGAKEDLIYLDDLREVEPQTEKMYQAFYREHHRAKKLNKSSSLLSDLIPKQDKKSDKEIENFELTPETNYKDYLRVEAKTRYRRRKHNGDNGIIDAHPA